MPESSNASFPPMHERITNVSPKLTHFLDQVGAIEEDLKGYTCEAFQAIKPELPTEAEMEIYEKTIKELRIGVIPADTTGRLEYYDRFSERLLNMASTLPIDMASMAFHYERSIIEKAIAYTEKELEELRDNIHQDPQKRKEYTKILHIRSFCKLGVRLFSIGITKEVVENALPPLCMTS